MRDQRTLLNLTQQQVAEGVGGDLTKNIVSEIERGVRDLPEQRSAIQTFLDTKAAEAANDEGENNDVE